MFDKNQLVQVKWNNTNKEWYTSKGYLYTKRHDVFHVKAKDLSPQSAIKVKMICDYCGSEYTTTYAVAMVGHKKYPKDACAHCAPIKANEMNYDKRASKKIASAQKVCDECGYELLTKKSEYIDAKMDVRFICPKHGEQTMMLDNFLRGHKCKRCAYEKNGNKLKHSTEFIKQYIESFNNNILLNPDDYKDTFCRNLKIRCNCGNEFVTSFANYEKHEIRRCSSCAQKESVGEKRVREFLDSHEIKFEQEKRFKDCRDIKPLPFDFYLPEYNLIIEFDGQHHYEDVMFGNHESTKKHDEIKDRYCDANHIHLLRIPYWDGSNIEKIIANKLNL